MTDGFLEKTSCGDRWRNFAGSYKGDIVNGEPHGRGILTGRMGGEGGPDKSVVYNGQWNDGKIHGRGTLTIEDSIIYEGGFAACYKDGKGKLTDTKLNYTEEGEWKQDRLVRGSLRLADGRWFDGEWRVSYSNSYPTKGILGAADGTQQAVEFDGSTFMSALSWPRPPN